MKKLKEELFINAEQIYDKNLIDKFRKLIFNIGWAIISDEYLVAEDEDLDHIEE